MPLSEELVKWADLMQVMEMWHGNRLNRKFGKAPGGKRIVVIKIPEEYDRMDPELIQLLENRCAQYIQSNFEHPMGGGHT